LSGPDAVVILTDHSSFDYARIVAKSRVLVDARNATRSVTGVEAAAGSPRWIVKKG